jgi:hypothetical protein
MNVISTIPVSGEMVMPLVSISLYLWKGALFLHTGQVMVATDKPGLILSSNTVLQAGHLIFIFSMISLSSSFSSF